MKLYRIRDWSSIYENNRTRELKRLDWVPIPNNHDGDGYTILVTQPDGAALLGAWVALVQVASKCDPRGTLLRRSRTPHDAASLSRITRLPEEIFNRVFDVATRLCKWLETEDLQTIPQDDATIPQDVAPRVRARVCALREGKGMEGKGMEERDASLSPVLTIKEVFNYWNDSDILPRCLILTDKRRRSLEIRVRNPFFQANWKTAIERIRSSDFCKGQSERGWRASFDWFIQPESCPKIIEGKYDNRPKAHQRNGRENPRNAGVTTDISRQQDLIRAKLTRDTAAQRANSDALAAQMAGPRMSPPGHPGNG